MDRYKRSNIEKNGDRHSPKASIEVTCADPIDLQIRSIMADQLNRTGCAVVDSDKASWVYSIIALQRGDFVELPIILRKFSFLR